MSVERMGKALCIEVKPKRIDGVFLIDNELEGHVTRRERKRNIPFDIYVEPLFEVIYTIFGCLKMRRV